MPSIANTATTNGVGGALKHRLNYLIARQGIISGNIANASTPNYLAKDIDFNKTLTKASLKMNTTSSKHLSGKSYIKPSAITEDKINIKHDGNSVKLDEQMLKLNDIQMNHRLITNLYAKHAGMHKMAVSANRR